MIRHRPKVVRRTEETDQGTAWVHQLTCSCGHTGEQHLTRRPADDDRARHLSDIAPPVEQRCQRPREHGCHRWDHCPLCADQLSLFEEVAS